MTDIQSTSSGAASQGLFGRDTDSSGLDSQDSVDLYPQSHINKQQSSHDMTTEEKLKSSQSPLDYFLTETSQLATDATGAMTDLATDAYQGLKEINQEYALDQRALGALKMAGGLGEAFIGSVGIVAPEPLTSVGGGAIFVHGVDVFQSGFQEVITGRPVETVTDQVTTESAKLLGADDSTSEQIGDSVDIGLSLASTGVGVYQAMTRPVVAELGPMTIKSSPKTDPSTEFSAGGKSQAGKSSALSAEVASPTSMQPVKVSDDIAGSVDKTGNLQVAEGLGKTASSETANTARVGNSASDSDIFLNVASGGKRGEVSLTTAQRAEVDNYLRNFNLDGVAIRHVDDTNLSTGYLHGDLFSVLNIGSDVVPGNVGLGTLTANSRVSLRGTLAHEVVGHREAALAGRTQSIPFLEEAQASIRAARFAPDLTSTERFTLLRDGITRFQDEGMKVRDVKDQLFIQQR